MKRYLLLILSMWFTLGALTAQDFEYYPKEKKTQKQKPQKQEDRYIDIEEIEEADDDVEVKRTQHKRIKPLAIHKKQRTDDFTNQLDASDLSLVSYRGMFDVGFGEDLSANKFAMSLSTTHGMQISPFFFIGLGVGYSYLPDNAYYPKYEEPGSGYYHQDKKHAYGNYWVIDSPTLYGGGRTDRHAFNYYLDLRANMAKGNWIPYVDLKLGGSTFTSYSKGGKVKKEYSEYSEYYDRYMYETRWYRARPHKGVSTSFFCEVGVGMVIYKYFDIRVSWTRSNYNNGFYNELDSATDYGENSLQVKLGVCF